MHKNRIIPTLGVAVLLPLWAWAQGPAPGPVGTAPAAGKAAEAPERPPTEAETLIDKGVKKIAALKSVAADLVQKVEMLNQKFQVSGRFLKAPERRIYLRLTVSGLPDSGGTTLQVCDGKTLWDYQQVLEVPPMYRKLDVVKVFEKLDAPELDAKFREQVLSELGFGGPETLLRGLRKAVVFDQKEEGTLDGQAVWILHGTWKDRSGLLGPNQQPLPETAPLPAYVPSVVTLWLGKEDGWPYKLLLVGKAPSILEDTRPVGPDGQRIGAKTAAPKAVATRVELSYQNVKLNATLKLDEFVFQAPPNANIQDDTEGLVSALDQRIRVEASKGKAPESGEKLLEETLKVPKVPDAPAEK